VAVAALAVTGAGQIALAPPVAAISSGDGLNNWWGFDTCGLQSTSEMQYLWTNSLYEWNAVYIGGDEAEYVAHCSFPNASWLNTVESYGWNFVFIWDGLQAPNCNDTNAYAFSTNPTTAEGQGQLQAEDAWDTLVGPDGVSNDALDSTLVDDLEGYEHYCTNYPYQSAVTAFISGWDGYLKTGYPQTYGVYGSICDSNLSAAAGASPVPEFIWGADYDSNPNPAIMADGPGGCGVPNGYWVNNQRLKQYDQEVTSHGIVLDQDCADGPTSPSGLWATNFESQCWYNTVQP
jgi:hypothetical protein